MPMNATVNAMGPRMHSARAMRLTIRFTGRIMRWLLAENQLLI
jgi:hypothetical protein